MVGQSCASNFENNIGYQYSPWLILRGRYWDFYWRHFMFGMFLTGPDLIASFLWSSIHGSRNPMQAIKERSN